MMIQWVNSDLEFVCIHTSTPYHFVRGTYEMSQRMNHLRHPPELTPNSVIRKHLSSERNSFHFIERNLITSAVVEPGGARRFMAGHVLGDLQLAAILEIGGDSRCPETMSTHLGPQPSRFCSALDHQVHIGLGQGSAAGQPAMAQGREERGIGFAGEPGCGGPLL